MARVSIVVPTYGRAELIDEALESIRNQTYHDYEVVVVDDCSPEDAGIAERVLKLNDYRFKYIYLNQRKGPAVARNIGIQKTKGEFISFIDSDDLWLPGKLEEHVKILGSNNDVAMVYSDEYIMYKDGRISEKPIRADRGKKLPSGYIAGDFLSESFIATMTVTLRRDVFNKVGGFDEELIWNEDDDLWLRIMIGHKVVCSDYPCGIRRLHQQNMSIDRDMMVTYQMKCIEKYIRDYPMLIRNNSKAVRRRLLKICIGYVKSKAAGRSLPCNNTLDNILRTYMKVLNINWFPILAG